VLDESKNKIIVISLIIIFIIIASLGIVLIEDGANGITALEGKKIADELAKEWRQDAVLYSINEGSTMVGEGHFQIWGYHYYDGPNVTTTTECLGITVESNGDTFIFHNSTIDKTIPIGNISLDSDDAYNIVKDIPAINPYLETNPSVEIFSLDASTGTPIWTIEFVEASLVDNARWAQVRIDANTGEVLFTSVDN